MTRAIKSFRIKTGSSLRFFGLLVFISLLVFGPVFYGAVMDWHIAVISIASISVIISWMVSELAGRDTTYFNGASDRSVYRFLIIFLPLIFLLYTLLHLVSLPEWLLGILSPAREDVNLACGIEGGSPVSVAPYTTRIWFFRILSCAVAFYAAAFMLRTRKNIMLVLSAVVILGYILSLYGLLQHLSGETLPSLFVRKYSKGKVSGTYVNSSHFAGYLEMVTPLALSIIFIKRGRDSGSRLTLGRRIISFLSEKLEDKRLLLPLTAALIMAIALMFTMSRMGIIAFSVSLVVFGFVLGGSHGLKKRLAVIASVVALVLTVSIWLGLDPLYEKYSRTVAGAEGRFQAWKMAGKIAGDYYLTGTGPGTFTHVSPAYQTLETSTGHWGEAHNDYLNLFSDAGLLGFLTGAGFVVFWFIHVLKQLRRRSLRTYQRSIVAGCMAGVTAILIHSISDFNLQIPANAFYFATLMGLAVGVIRIKNHVNEKPSKNNGGDKGNGGSENENNLSKFLAKSSVLAVSTIFLLWAIGTFRAQYYLEEGIAASEVELKKSLLERSISVDEGNPRARYQNALVFYDNSGEVETSMGEMKEAIKLLPYQGKYHYRLGIAYARLQREEDSEKELYLALRFAPYHPAILYKVGYFHFFKWKRTGDLEAFEKSFSEFRRAAEVNSAYLEHSLDVIDKHLADYLYMKMVVPVNPQANRRFADYLAGKGMWKKALEEYRRTWRLEVEADNSYRGDEDLILSLAKSYLMNGKLEDAQLGYDKALKATLKPGGVIEKIMSDYKSAGRIKEGIAYLESLREEYKNGYRLDIEIAKARIILGDFDKAEALLLKVANSRPSEEIYRLLYRSAMSMADYDLAQVYIERALKLVPSNAENYFFLSRALRAEGDYREALEAINAAMVLDARNPAYKRESDKLRELIFFED